MRRRDLLAAALASAALPARGQQAPAIEWGQVYGTGHQPVPAGAALSARPLDDKPQNMQILRRLGDALRQAGRSLRNDPGTRLVLNFDTEIERVPQTLQRGVSDTRGRVKFALTMTVDDAQSGQRLWSGEASYLAAPNDETLVFNQLAQLLVQEIGKTSKVRGFTLE
jgi:hypothetical protein